MGKRRPDKRLRRQRDKGRQRRWAKRAHNPAIRDEASRNAATTQYGAHARGIRIDEEYQRKWENLFGRPGGQARVEALNNGAVMVTSNKHADDVALTIEQTDFRQWIKGFKKQSMSQGKEIVDLLFSGMEHYFVRYDRLKDEWMRSICYYGRKRAMIAYAIYSKSNTGITWVKRLPAPPWPTPVG